MFSKCLLSGFTDIFPLAFIAWYGGYHLHFYSTSLQILRNMKALSIKPGMMKWICSLLLLLPVLSHAETIKWEGQKGIMEIGNKVEVLEDVTGKLSFAEVCSPQWQSKFRPSKTINLILGYT